MIYFNRESSIEVDPQTQVAELQAELETVRQAAHAATDDMAGELLTLRAWATKAYMHMAHPSQSNDERYQLFTRLLREAPDSVRGEHA